MLGLKFDQVPGPRLPRFAKFGTGEVLRMECGVTIEVSL